MKRNKRKRTKAQIEIDVARKMAPWPTIADYSGAAGRELMSGKRLGLLRKQGQPE